MSLNFLFFFQDWQKDPFYLTLKDCDFNTRFLKKKNKTKGEKNLAKEDKQKKEQK